MTDYQMARLDQEKAEIEMQLKRLKQELQTAQLELNKTSTQYKDAQNQIQMLSKEKGETECTSTYVCCSVRFMYLCPVVGVAMRDNAASYQQSIQLETKLRELQTEQQITQQQRDIANKERDKVVMESVSLKVSWDNYDKYYSRWG